MTKVVNCSWWGGCILSLLYTLLKAEAPFYWQFGRGGTIFLVNWGGGSEVFFMSKTVLEVGCSFVF